MPDLADLCQSRNRDIVKWLAPFTADDLRSAYDYAPLALAREVSIDQRCEKWMRPGLSDAGTQMLWLTGMAGAGKNVILSC